MRAHDATNRHGCCAPRAAYRRARATDAPNAVEPATKVRHRIGMSVARTARLARLAACVALCACAAACTLFTPSTAGSSHNYTGAAAFAGSAVAGAGVNRAITGQCWAQCPPGTTCNHASGVCERLPCSSTCPADLQCEQVGGEFVCVQPRSEGALAARSADAGQDTGAAQAPDAGGGAR
jgi:hypothetical protein